MKYINHATNTISAISVIYLIVIGVLLLSTSGCASIEMKDPQYATQSEQADKNLRDLSHFISAIIFAIH